MKCIISISLRILSTETNPELLNKSLERHGNQEEELRDKF